MEVNFLAIGFVIFIVILVRIVDIITKYFFVFEKFKNKEYLKFLEEMQKYKGVEIIKKFESDKKFYEMFNLHMSKMHKAMLINFPIFLLIFVIAKKIFDKYFRYTLSFNSSYPLIGNALEFLGSFIIFSLLMNIVLIVIKKKIKNNIIKYLI